jgi:hypothetical protein
LTDATGRYVVEPISFGEARRLIEARHYLGQLRKSGDAFGLIADSEIIGAAVFGQPSREGVVVALWDDGTLENTTELLRFFTVDGVEPWLGTWFLSRAVRALPRTVEMVVAFSDPAYGHHGGLYQAASWVYTGLTTNTPYHYEDGGGNRIGKQTPWKQARRERERGLVPAGETPADGERRVALERGWRRVRDEPKHRYVYPRTRRAKRRLRQASVPYPKPDRAA